MADSKDAAKPEPRLNAKRFVEYFTRRVEQISSLSDDADQKVFKKTLFVSLLDAVARSVYPAESNHDRFVLFIRNFGKWPDADRVSLPHLVVLLSRLPEPDFAKARRFALAEIAKWKAGDQPPLRLDPTYDEVRKLWPADNHSKVVFEKIKLESLLHAELLYRYRNGLVHELRELGYAQEIRQDMEPCYLSAHAIGTTGADGEKMEHSWELNYPVKFFETLSLSCLGNLDKYLHENDLNPYRSYRFGTYWFEALNKSC
jgi:hypothetical protein